MQKTLLTPKDLEAELPDLGRSTIYALLKAGTIPSIRLGKKFFTPRAAFDLWLANCCACAVNPAHDEGAGKR
jgi:excisionase family DNA binding protein